MSTNDRINSFSCTICNSQRDNYGIYESSPHPTNILDKDNKTICTCPCLLQKTYHYSGKSIIGCNICNNTLGCPHTKNYCPMNPKMKKLIICWTLLMSIKEIQNESIEHIYLSLNKIS